MNIFSQVISASLSAITFENFERENRLYNVDIRYKGEFKIQLHMDFRETSNQALIIQAVTIHDADDRRQQQIAITNQVNVSDSF